VRSWESGEQIMKRNDRGTEGGRIDRDEILPEYDFKEARPNKYASRYAADGAVMAIKPHIAAPLPNPRDGGFQRGSAGSSGKELAARRPGLPKSAISAPANDNTR